MQGDSLGRFKRDERIYSGYLQVGGLEDSVTAQSGKMEARKEEGSRMQPQSKGKGLSTHCRGANANVLHRKTEEIGDLDTAVQRRWQQRTHTFRKAGALPNGHTCTSFTVLSHLGCKPVGQCHHNWGAFPPSCGPWVNRSQT